MIIGVTGHRDVEQEPGELLSFARLSVARMVQHGVTEIITGLARGWDLAVARAAFDAGVPYCAAIPFPAQPDLWPLSDQNEWAWAVKRASRQHVLGKLPLKHYYERRNRWIVDESEEIWSLYDGRPGGTRNCVLYANDTSRIVRPLWGPWIRFRAERNS